MCELFGVSSAKPIKINKYLVELVAHSCDNPHGWGFANFREHKVTLHKHPGKASESVQIMSFLKEEIWVNKFFAHIRMGTRGRRSYLNCHPFTVVDCMQRQWTLQHNGTIFNDCNSYYSIISHQLCRSSVRPYCMSCNSLYKSDNTGPGRSPNI